MTLVRMGLRAPLELAAGRMEWRTHRHVNGDDVVLPVVVRLALNEDVATVANLTPGTWMVQEFVAGNVGATRTVLVPDTDRTVNYAELVDVDPATLEPNEDAVPAWTAAVEVVRGHAVDSASSAALSSDAASTAASWALVAEAQADETVELAAEAAESARSAQAALAEIRRYLEAL